MGGGWEGEMSVVAGGGGLMRGGGGVMERVKRWRTAFSRLRLARPAGRPSSVRVCVIIAVTLGAVGPRGERCLGDG